MNKRKQKSAQEDSRDKSRRKYDYDDEEDDDDDDFGSLYCFISCVLCLFKWLENLYFSSLVVPLSPGGSVLMPSPNPYNMSERIKRANQQLEEEKKRAALPSRVPKVRFVDPVPLDDDEVVGKHEF